MKGKILVVQGGQYGSEGKGEICGWLAVNHPQVFSTVRTGAINAGHTVHYRGQRFQMQQVPCGWVNPWTQLFIGPGAYIHEPTLMREITDIKARAGLDILPRLFVDYNAGVHLDSYMNEATLAGRHVTIGATGKGCAEATIDKIRRRGDPGWLGTYKDYCTIPELKFADIPALIDQDISFGGTILVEGTQGTLLDLHLGSYPYTTSRMTTAAAWLAEAGIAPTHIVETLLVLRTFPIRVAGNSGPLPNEVTWPDMWDRWRGHPNAPQVGLVDAAEWRRRVDEASWSGFHDQQPHFLDEDRRTYMGDLSRAQSQALAFWKGADGIDSGYQAVSGAMEMTTVTRKPRRIGQFSAYDAKRAATIEHPTYLALTFINYLFPALWGGCLITKGEVNLHLEAARRWMDWVAGSLGAPVALYTLGPLPTNFVSLRDWR